MFSSPFLKTLSINNSPISLINLLLFIIQFWIDNNNNNTKEKSLNFVKRCDKIQIVSFIFCLSNSFVTRSNKIDKFLIKDINLK